MCPRKYEGEDERSRFFPHQITLLGRDRGKKRINWNDLFPFSSFWLPFNIPLFHSFHNAYTFNSLSVEKCCMDLSSMK